jgi:hypothetical protein
MAVHEINERPDGTVDEFHEFSAEEWADLADRLAPGGAGDHHSVYQFARRGELTANDAENRTVRALSIVFAVAQYDPRFRLEAR